MELTCQSCQSKTTVADDAIGDVTCSSCGKPLEMSRPDLGGATAARREKGRGADQDLFGSVAKAGSEDEPAKSAAKEPEKEDAKLTGQRNESSVLFSLGSLTKEAEKEKKDESTTAKGDGSGLIDIRSLAGATGSTKSEGSKKPVDDIMNLGGGGGAFGAALTSPMLAPPAPEVMAAAEPAAQQSGGSKNGIIFAILGGAAFLTIAVVATLVLTRKPEGAETPNERTGKTETSPTGSSTGASTAKAEPSSTGTGASTAAASATAPATAATGASTVAAKDPTPAHTSTGGTAGTAGGTPTAKTTATAANTGSPTPPGPAPTTAPPKPADDGSGKPPFNRGEASAALAAVNIANCKKPDGPTGNGHVVVTFDPSGTVQSAVVDDGPFPGTPVGGCIAGRFRGAHVSPFSGSAVKVGKSFSL